MLLLVPGLLACVIALLRGGSLGNLAVLQIRAGYLIVLSFVIQLVIYYPALRHSALVLHWAAPIYVGALALAVMGMLQNGHLGLPVRLATLGLLLNMTAIAINGGHMPVNAAAIGAVQGQWKVHELQDPDTYGNTRLASPDSRLLPLTDVIPVQLPGGPGNVYSVGDLLITSGVAVLVYRATSKSVVTC